MKVRKSLGNAAGMAGTPVKEAKAKSAAGISDFHNQLIRTEEDNYAQHLEKLVQDIVSQGETLAKRIDIRELKIYKKLISEFLATVLSNSRKFSKKSMLDRRGRRKVYAIIKNINSELDQLTQDVLSGETENISLLKRIEDIRGLIMDLLL
ncbi:MAG: YaaR family protein [Acetivibrionales bacterium]|jgi:uncharacterized protein YaaR (DUF327 family)